VPRGLLLTPSSPTTTGRFGRMFRRLPVYEHRPATLVALGNTMIQQLENGKLDEPLDEPDDPDENRGKLDGKLRLPAGYTYFGQFVDHDITFDPVSTLDRQNDPDALTDFRTPALDLDSLYGAGPANQPYLYDADRVKLLLDPTGNDLQRNVNGRALIGDPRNDENLIVSQLQVAFIRFHNAAVDFLEEHEPALVKDRDRLFKRAQQTVRWHYQWVVVNDFLPRLVGGDVVRDILRFKDFRSPTGTHTTMRPRLLFYKWRAQPFMPVEFSVAAYRYGHSMARPSYLINDSIVEPVVRDFASRIPLFSDSDRKTLQNLNGFGPLPAGGRVQWKYFLDGVKDPKGARDGFLPQPSYKIDTKLGHPLGDLPANVASARALFDHIPLEAMRSLPVRNLLRARALGLPAGQDVARAMGITPIADRVLLENLDFAGDLTGLGTDEQAVREDLAGRAPLWFYVLREAEVEAKSEHLGPVGGRIVAEVLIGLLAGDPLSYLGVDPSWRPFLGPTPRQFTLTDLINLGL
jgi:hypothetical protein